MKLNTELVMNTGQDSEEALVVGRGDKYRTMDVLLSSASNIREGLPSCIILPIFGLALSRKI
jgi:hypothetical protein